MRQASKGQHKASRRSEMLFLHQETSHKLVGKRQLIQTFSCRSPEQTDFQQVIASFRKFDTSPADTTVSTSKILISPRVLQQQKGKKIPKAMTQVTVNNSISTPNARGLSPHAEANSMSSFSLMQWFKKKSQFSTLSQCQQESTSLFQNLMQIHTSTRILPSLLVHSGQRIYRKLLKKGVLFACF